MLKKNSLVALLLLLVMTGAGCATQPQPASPQPTPARQTVQEQVTLKVLDKAYTQAFVKDQTVYEFMKALEASQDFKFDGKDYGQEMGFFVQSINSQTNDNTKNLYWVFYLNDKKSDVGISSARLNPNDVITWKYEALEF
ncbi:MAG: DUF4430 domain-containing protein [Patescibacteria group bacterium]|nr:DUF4430 domain-containing protein [Patescibacteria group bacterium]